MAQCDKELIAGICERDADAFEELYARCAEKVRRHLVRMVRNRAATEDLLQEAAQAEQVTVPETPPLTEQEEEEQEEESEQEPSAEVIEEPEDTPEDDEDA